MGTQVPSGVMALEVSAALSAGVTTTYYLNGICLPGSAIDSYTVDSVLLKAEIIKR
jgi:hypothetical protein